MELSPSMELSLKMEYDSKWNVTQNGMSLQIKCHTKWNVTQVEFWKVIQNGISLKTKKI